MYGSLFIEINGDCKTSDSSAVNHSTLTWKDDGVSGTTVDLTPSRTAEGLSPQPLASLRYSARQM